MVGLEAKSEAVEQMVKSAGGFVARNRRGTDEDGHKAASVIARVPAAWFEAILGQIAKLGEVKAKNVTGEGITDQVSDEEQAKRVPAYRIREKETRSRLNLIKMRVALSTVTVQLHEKS